MSKNTALFSIIEQEERLGQSWSRAKASADEVDFPSHPAPPHQGQHRLRARAGRREMGRELSIGNFSPFQCFANRSCLLLTPACPPLPQGSSQNGPVLCGRACWAMMGRSGRLRLHGPGLAKSTPGPACSLAAELRLGC